MQRIKTYEFRAHFPLCELDFGQEPAGGGQGAANNAAKEKHTMQIMPDVGRLPLYVCGPVILLLSVGCYWAGYEILTGLTRFFSTF